MNPEISQLGVNIISVHAHVPPSPSDDISTDFLDALKNFDPHSGSIIIDGIPCNFMGGMMPQAEKNHDGVEGLTGVDALLIRIS